MKKSWKRFRICSFPLTLLLISVFFLTSCDNEPTDDTASKMIGTWHQQSRSLDGAEILKDSSRLVMQINSNQICVLCDSTTAAVTGNKVVKRSGWSYNGGLFNLAIDIPVSWKPTISTDQLSLEKIEFSQTGTIKRTVLTYKRITDIEFN